MTVAWLCRKAIYHGPGVVVNFYVGEYQDDWRDWGVRGTLIWH